MGGIIGMMLASLPNSPIRKLVLNDIGGFVGKSSLEFIASYVSTQPSSFENFESAINYFMSVHKSFGIKDEDHWRDITRSSVKDIGDGKCSLRIDPGVGSVFKNVSFQDLPLWFLWDQIKCPVMLVRGEQSTLLTASTAEEMKTRGPGLSAFHQVENVGHAPSLMEKQQVDPIKEFLLKN